jgi:hypothetical protein
METMKLPEGVTFEYGLDGDRARYYGVIRLPGGSFLTTGPNYHSVEEAESKAKEILAELWALCAAANRGG